MAKFVIKLREKLPSKLPVKLLEGASGMATLSGVTLNAGNPYRKGSLSMIDLLVLTNLNQLLLEIKLEFTLLHNLNNGGQLY